MRGLWIANMGKFTKGKSCLADLMTIYSGVTASIKKGGATDVVYLDFCKAFEKVPFCLQHWRGGFDTRTVRWMKS